jgi:hypothetical protein
MILNPIGGGEVLIPDEWLSVAGMLSFKSESSAYRASPHSTLVTRVLAIDKIRLFRRSPGVRDFDRDRMLSVLDAIRRDQALPPIEVEADDTNSDRFSHRLYHGFHRFHASIVAGFSHVPALIVDMRGLRESTGAPSV